MSWQSTISETETLLKDTDFVEYRQQLRNQIKGHTKVYTSDPVQRYKERVKSGYYNFTPYREMRELVRIMDRVSYTTNEWSYLYRRWRTVDKRISKPSPHYVLTGGKRMIIDASEEYEMLKMVQDLNVIMEGI
jgi:hypothetical protein